MFSTVREKAFKKIIFKKLKITETQLLPILKPIRILSLISVWPEWKKKIKQNLSFVEYILSDRVAHAQIMDLS